MREKPTRLKEFAKELRRNAKIIYQLSQIEENDPLINQLKNELEDSNKKLVKIRSELQKNQTK